MEKCSAHKKCALVQKHPRKVENYLYYPNETKSGYRFDSRRGCRAQTTLKSQNHKITLLVKLLIVSIKSALPHGKALLLSKISNFSIENQPISVLSSYWFHRYCSGFSGITLKVEKPREFDPRGQATLTPASKNTLTPYGKIKMTPENNCCFRGFL